MSKATEIIVTTAAACLLPVGAAITFIIAHELIHAPRHPSGPSTLCRGNYSFGRRLRGQTAQRSDGSAVTSVFQIS
jgi:hypothetical protein